MRERSIEAIIAVVKFAIVNPGTNLDDAYKRKTLIKNAKIPKVTTEIGRAISCKIGFMKVFTTPITIAATIAAQKVAKENPGTR